jgi:cation diffusion facilitator family transporter
VKAHELPPDLRPVHARAVRLEWLTIGYLLSAIFFLYLTLGNSQAMKAAWIEDCLSLLPPAAFLLAARLRRRPPGERFPWGHHRAVSIAYLTASFALLVLGGYVLFESALKLVTAEHPSIGTVVVLGEQVWLGWLMLPALAWTGLPAVVLGRKKLPLADALHDKVLYADAEMNRADWMTAGAAAVGVIGIAFGLWFADAVAAGVIALDILRDGWRNVRAAVDDLMDARPRRYDNRADHPLVDEAREALRRLDWVADARVRLRENGHVLTGEAFVVPVDGQDVVERVAAARDALNDLDWQLHDIVVTPVDRRGLPDRV